MSAFEKSSFHLLSSSWRFCHKFCARGSNTSGRGNLLGPYFSPRSTLKCARHHCKEQADASFNMTIMTIMILAIRPGVKYCLVDYLMLIIYHRNVMIHALLCWYIDLATLMWRSIEISFIKSIETQPMILAGCFHRSPTIPISCRTLI